MPAEQTGCCEWCPAVRSRIEHHFHHTLDMTIYRCQSTDIHPQSAGNAGTHGSRVQLLAFNRTGFDDIFCQCEEAGLITQSHTDIRESPQQQALCLADFGHGAR